MHLEEFAGGSSLLHKLDPRIKLVAAFLFSLAAALADRPLVLAAGLAASVLLLFLARLPWAKVAYRLALVNVFIVLIWVFLPFSQPGRPWFHLAGLTASVEGVRLAAEITVKSNAIVLAIITLLSTSPIFALVHALRHLYVPDKLVNLFFFTYRYFQVIHREYLRLRAAMKVRCFRPRTDWHTYRSLAFLLGMLLVRSLDRAARVHQAMLCRGFDGRFWMLDHFALKRRDLVFFGLMILLVAGMMAGPWMMG
ncbi:MAG: cobalt ECF transporter T component CbiQ [Thermodesulfobacteriota bacterium]